MLLCVEFYVTIYSLYFSTVHIPGFVIEEFIFTCYSAATFSSIETFYEILHQLSWNCIESFKFFRKFRYATTLLSVGYPFRFLYCIQTRSNAYIMKVRARRVVYGGTFFSLLLQKGVYIRRANR